MMLVNLVVMLISRGIPRGIANISRGTAADISRVIPNFLVLLLLIYLVVLLIYLVMLLLC